MISSTISRNARWLSLFMVMLLVCGCEYRQTYGDVTCTSSSQPISNLLLRLKVVPAKTQRSGKVRFVARTHKYPIGFQALLTNRFGQSDGCGVSITPPENVIDITVTEEWAEPPTTIGFYATTGLTVVVEVVDERGVVLTTDRILVTVAEQERFLDWRIR
jgi:hypothetical protein